VWGGVRQGQYSSFLMAVCMCVHALACVHMSDVPQIQVPAVLLCMCCACPGNSSLGEVWLLCLTRVPLALHPQSIIELCMCCLQGRKKIRIARASSNWLDIQYFDSTAAAVQALRAEVSAGSTAAAVLLGRSMAVFCTHSSIAQPLTQWRTLTMHTPMSVILPCVLCASLFRKR
jgi:hypothetical protein